MRIPMPYEPVEGKTYSLFGKDDSTSGYYGKIRQVADEVIIRMEDPAWVLQVLREHSRNKQQLRRITKRKEDAGELTFIVELLNKELSGYTLNVESHLATLPLRKYRDRRLRTTREQYHLYMLEIELANRTNIREFLEADKKIALLPYCLKDFDADCRSSPDEFDLQCRYCSKFCYEQYASRLLKLYGIEAYIWMEADLKKFGRRMAGENKTLSILGIACIPELVSGIRKCLAFGIPAVGIPLDANRCIRWMGEFHKNSVNLDELKRLIEKGSTT